MKPWGMVHLKREQNNNEGSEGNAAINFAHQIFDTLDPNLVNNYLESDPALTHAVAEKFLHVANRTPETLEQDAENFRNLVTNHDDWLARLDQMVAAIPPNIEPTSSPPSQGQLPATDSAVNLQQDALADTLANHLSPQLDQVVDKLFHNQPSSAQIADWIHHNSSQAEHAFSLLKDFVTAAGISLDDPYRANAVRNLILQSTSPGSEMSWISQLEHWKAYATATPDPSLPERRASELLTLTLPNGESVAWIQTYKMTYFSNCPVWIQESNEEIVQRMCEAGMPLESAMRAFGLNVYGFPVAFRDPRAEADRAVDSMMSRSTGGAGVSSEFATDENGNRVGGGGIIFTDGDGNQYVGHQGSNQWTVNTGGGSSYTTTVGQDGTLGAVQGTLSDGQRFVVNNSTQTTFGGGPIGVDFTGNTPLTSLATESNGGTPPATTGSTRDPDPNFLAANSGTDGHGGDRDYHADGSSTLTFTTVRDGVTTSHTIFYNADGTISNATSLNDLQSLQQMDGAVPGTGPTGNGGNGARAENAEGGGVENDETTNQVVIVGSRSGANNNDGSDSLVVGGVSFDSDLHLKAYDTLVSRFGSDFDKQLSTEIISRYRSWISHYVVYGGYSPEEIATMMRDPNFSFVPLAEPQIGQVGMPAGNGYHIAGPNEPGAVPGAGEDGVIRWIAPDQHNAFDENVGKIPEGFRILGQSVAGWWESYHPDDPPGDRLLYAARDAINAAKIQYDQFQNVTADQSLREKGLILVGGLLNMGIDTIAGLGRAYDTLANPNSTPQEVALAIVEVAGAAITIVTAGTAGAAAANGVRGVIGASTQGLTDAAIAAGRVADQLILGLSNPAGDARGVAGRAGATAGDAPPSHGGTGIADGAVNHAGTSAADGAGNATATARNPAGGAVETVNSGAARVQIGQEVPVGGENISSPLNLDFPDSPNIRSSLNAVASPEATDSLMRSVMNRTDVDFQRINSNIVSSVQDKGIAVRFTTEDDLLGGALGRFAIENGNPVVYVREGMSPEMTYSTLTHEISHANDYTNRVNKGEGVIEFSSPNGDIRIKDYSNFVTVSEAKSANVEIASQKMVLETSLAKGDLDAAKNIVSNMSDTIKFQGSLIQEQMITLPALVRAIDEGVPFMTKAVEGTPNLMEYTIAVTTAEGRQRNVSIVLRAGLSTGEAALQIRNSVSSAVHDLQNDIQRYNSNVDYFNAARTLVKNGGLDAPPLRLGGGG